MTVGRAVRPARGERPRRERELRRPARRPGRGRPRRAIGTNLPRRRPRVDRLLRSVADAGHLRLPRPRLLLDARRWRRCSSTPVTPLGARDRAERAGDARGRRHVRPRPRGADRGLRDSIARGFVPGPTLQISVDPHLPDRRPRRRLPRAVPGSSGPLIVPDYPGRPPLRRRRRRGDAARRARRSSRRSGLDQARHDRRPRLRSRPARSSRSFTPEEIAVAVSEASRKGKPVAAHAYGGEGLDNAVAAGVSSIEHGGFLTEEQAALMAEARLLARADALGHARHPALGGGGRPHADSVPKILDFGLELGGVRPHRQGARRADGLGHRLHQPRAARHEPRGARC